ncbi:MAG: DUF4843 domain-containing protein [Candidatus Cryptobacteroides sp.]
MKKAIITTIVSVVLAAVAVQSCKVQEVPVFSGDDTYVYFKRYIKDEDGNNVRVDTVQMSFSHYYGATEYTQEFYLGLVGQVPERDMEYAVELVEDQTTAEPGQYSLPEKLIFREGHIEDTLRVTVYKDKLADGDERVLRLRLVESDDLKVAYTNPTDSYAEIQLRFNNRIVKPTWWTNNIAKVFFGEYSYKKYTTIIIANPGIDPQTIGDLSSAELRNIALKTKEYIRENGITEEDGSPMMIPIN